MQPEGAEGLAPPPCGQLTRCLSAVAELLVISAASNVPRPTKVATHPDLESRPQSSRPRPRTWSPCLPLTESVLSIAPTDK